MITIHPEGGRVLKRLPQNHKCKSHCGTRGRVKESTKNEDTWSGDTLSPSLFVPHLVRIHPAPVEIFHQIGENLDLLMALKEKLGITKVIRIYRLGNMDICIKFLGNPSSSC